jgi:hypothetical protein
MATGVFTVMGGASSVSLPPLSAARARTGFLLVRQHVTAGDLERAVAVYGESASLTVTPLSADLAAESARILVPALAAAGKVSAAVKTSLGLRSLLATAATRAAISDTGAFLLPRLERFPEKAAELCRAIGDASGRLDLLADACARVIVYYASCGRNGQAADFYLEFITRHRMESFTPQMLRPLALAQAALAESCLAEGRNLLAWKIYRQLLLPAFQSGAGGFEDFRGFLEGTGKEGRDKGPAPSGRKTPDGALPADRLSFPPGHAAACDAAAVLARRIASDADAEKAREGRGPECALLEALREAALSGDYVPPSGPSDGQGKGPGKASPPGTDPKANRTP